jgi:hypothetical protein
MVQWKDLLAAFALGSAVNFPWELAHSLLYRGVARFPVMQHLVCCGLAALADGIGIAAIFTTGAVVFRDPYWTRLCTPARVCLVVLLGLAGAVVTEHLALRLDWWGYGPAMPRVPGTNLGITPLVQSMVLPVVVLFLALPRRWKRDEAAN